MKTGPHSKAITGATNANPISITCTGHGFATGDLVVISGVLGNTNANGGYTITFVTANTFTLNGRAGNSSLHGEHRDCLRASEILQRYRHSQMAPESLGAF